MSASCPRRALNSDRSGTKRIGTYILNHSFMIQGLVATFTAVLAGLAIEKVFS